MNCITINEVYLMRVSKYKTGHAGNSGMPKNGHKVLSFSEKAKGKIKTKK